MNPSHPIGKHWRTTVSVVVIPLSACSVQWLFWEGMPFSWFLFWPAVYFSTWIGNHRDGMLATLFSAALAWWFFVPEPHTLIKAKPVLYFSALLFIGIGILLSLTQQRLKASRQRVADLLANAEQSHALLLESLADGVFVAQDYRFVFSNHALPAMLGYADNEFCNLHFHQVVAPAFLDVWIRRFEQRIGHRGEPEKYYEVQFLRRNGKSLWMELRENPTQYNGRPAVLGIVRDVSARKQQEARLRLAEAVFNNTQEALVVTDLRGNIVAVNPAFSVITEYPAEELTGRNMNILRSGRHDRDFYQQMWLSIQRTGSWQGPVWNRRKGGDIYQEWLSINTVKDEQGQPMQYVGISLDISRMPHVETHMEHMAHHDALTGLPNRLLLHSRLEHTLERSKRDGSGCAALFIDLDRFKAVNDTLGHEAGDDLLRLAAMRMRERLRDIDMLARLGGDEFVVVLDCISHGSEAEHVAQDLVERLSQPFHLQQETVLIGTSVGIALFPEHGWDSRSLIAAADAALYKAKEAGRGTWQIAVPNPFEAGILKTA